MGLEADLRPLSLNFVWSAPGLGRGSCACSISGSQICTVQPKGDDLSLFLTTNKSKGNAQVVNAVSSEKSGPITMPLLLTYM